MNRLYNADLSTAMLALLDCLVDMHEALAAVETTPERADAGRRATEAFRKVRASMVEKPTDDQGMTGVFMLMASRTLGSLGELALQQANAVERR